MSANTNNNADRVPHSKPIQIPNAAAGGHARRAVSFSPSSLDGSSDSGDDYSPPLRTPIETASTSPRVHTVPPRSPQTSTSPILSYFLASPTKTNAASAVLSPTSPGAFGSLGRGSAARPAEPTIDEGAEDAEPPLVRHARRMSTSAASAWPTAAPRFGQATMHEQHERGQALLRRLSLGSALVRPQFNNSAAQSTPAVLAPAAQIPVRTTSPPAMQSPPAGAERKKRRATMLNAPGEGGRRRAPSPMGERILKGHFDGFN